MNIQCDAQKSGTLSLRDDYFYVKDIFKIFTPSDAKFYRRIRSKFLVFIKAMIFNGHGYRINLSSN